MTVKATTNSKRFHGSGNNGPFPFPWRFMANADVRVYRVRNPNEADPSKETRELLALGANYSLTGAKKYTGGIVKDLSFNLPVGEDLIVQRWTTALQNTSFRDKGNFSAPVHEDAFDLMTMVIQDRDYATTSNTEMINGLSPRMANAEAAIAGLQAGLASSVYERAAVNGPVLLPAAGGAIVSIPLTDETGDPLIIQPSVEGQTIWGAPTYELAGAGATAMFILIGTDWRRVG